VTAAAGLDGRLLIGADDVLIICQRFSVPDALVQVEHPGGLGLQLRVADEDPRLVLPWFEGVLSQPTSDGGR
jgi:hypothetical protein